MVIFGGGSFGTAVGAALARQKSDLDVTMLLRDPYVCKDINSLHCNRRYLEVRETRHRQPWPGRPAASGQSPQNTSTAVRL